MKFKLLKSIVLPSLLLCFLSLSTVIIWFKDGKMLATGEEGLVLANPARSIQLYQYSWNEVGSGIAVPGVNPMIPYLHLELFLVNQGLPVWLIQAGTFAVLMFIGSFSCYLLTINFFKDQVSKEKLLVVGLVAAVFYLFNPISMLGVWYRFALSFMFFYALAPLFLYLFIVGLNKKRLIFIFLLPLITLLFSFGYSAPSSTLLLWLLPFIYTLVLSKSKSNNGHVEYNLLPLLYFFSMIVFWVVINLWWIIPFINLSTSAFASETDIGHAIGTLKANSKDFTVDNVIRLIHGGFLYRGEVFGSLYKTPLFILLSWTIPVLTILGAIQLRSNKVKIFLIVSMALLLFLVKGTSFPFGFIFLLIFKSSIIFQLYRNPLEKIGMLLPIIYSPLFAYGAYYLLWKIKNVSSRITVLFSVLFLLLLFHWPFFTGAMVTFGGRDIKVEVPSSFQAANQSIPIGDHRILSIPVMGGASGFYNWTSGYKGVDGSEYLFNYPTLTKTYDAKSFHGYILTAESEGKIDDNLIGTAQFFSADIIAFRKDTDVAAFGYNFDALKRSKKMIEQSNLTQIFDSPEVALFSLPQEKIVPVIYAPSSVRFGEFPEELLSLLKNKQYNPQSEIFICINKQKCSPFIEITDPALIKIEVSPKKVEYRKISPVNYEVKITGSAGRFILVFNNTYHPGWLLKMENEYLLTNRHIIANGYANGFVIDKVGSYNLSLEFAPEKNLLNGIKSSKVTMLAGLLVMIVLLLRRGWGWKNKGK